MKLDRRQLAAYTAYLPTLGIFAFALASVWSLYQLFNNSALHPTPLYWIPAALVEIVTAWLAYQAVESVRQMTRSKISKQDRKFAVFVFVLCVVMALPTMIVSFGANRYEFQGNIGLALLFPVSCIACAVASAIPHIKAQAGNAKTAKLREDAQRLRDAVRELERRCAELAQSRAMKEPSREVYEQLCANLNGNAPTDVREAAKLLNDAGYYTKADSTLRSWM